MFHEDLTAETLFYEPHLLERYLESLSEEVNTPFITRRQQKGESIDFSDETREVVKLLDIKESQIKLLISYLSLIIEKSQDKMIMQTETIEQQDREIEGLKEENITLREELKMFRGSLDELRKKHATMEEYLEDVEKRYENDKVNFNQAQLEAQILKGIKETLTETQLENTRLETLNNSLKENLEDLEEKLEILRQENNELKENFGVIKHNLATSTQFALEYEKMKTAYDKVCRGIELEVIRVKFAELEMEKNIFVSERRASEENLGLVSQKCILLQEELQKAKTLVSQKSLKRGNTIEDPNQNLNAKLAAAHKAYSDGSLEGSLVLDISNQEKNCNSRTLVSSTTLDTLENYASDQYDGIRGNPGSDTAGNKKSKQKPWVTQKFNTSEARYCYSPIEENSPRVSDIGSFDEEGNSGSTNHNSQRQPKRKNILEEFFLLTFQSCLLNSEHFNELAGIESAKLFQEVNHEDVPYFQWAKWLETKLEQIYKDTILPKRLALREQKKQKGLASKSVIVG